MSIDARIERIERNDDGTATMHLVPREKGGCAGQSSMTVLNPPPHFEAAVGTEVWGGDGYLMVGRETKWADRIGYTRCRLVDPAR